MIFVTEGFHVIHPQEVTSTGQNWNMSQDREPEMSRTWLVKDEAQQVRTEWCSWVLDKSHADWGTKGGVSEWIACLLRGFFSQPWLTLPSSLAPTTHIYADTSNAVVSRDTWTRIQWCLSHRGWLEPQTVLLLLMVKHGSIMSSEVQTVEVSTLYRIARVSRGNKETGIWLSGYRAVLLFRRLVGAVRLQRFIFHQKNKATQSRPFTKHLRIKNEQFILRAHHYYYNDWCGVACFTQANLNKTRILKHVALPRRSV